MKNKKALLTVGLFFTFFSGTPSSCCRPVNILQVQQQAPSEVFQTKLEELKTKVELLDQYGKNH